jgi:hypothetical protein
MPKFISYIMVTCLVFMLLFFSATAPDVMRKQGSNWVKPDWVAGTESDWSIREPHGEVHHDDGAQH